MKRLSQIMYTIGRVFNFVGIAIFLGMLIFGILTMVMPDLQRDIAMSDAVSASTVSEARAFGLIFLIVGAVFFVVFSVMFGLATYAKRALDNERKDIAPHILMIIIGSFGNFFYVAAGATGIVAEHQPPDNEIHI